jgi:predicted glutamine amidotransferase
MGGGIQRGDLKILEELSYVSSIRGTDATGVAFGNSHSRDPKIFKVAGDPFYFNFMAKDVKDYDNVFNNYYIGHTRAATVGDRSHRGAHPYQYGNLIGAHNGTISSYHKLDGFPTDSAKLYSSINEIGLQATLDTLDDRDALALVWYDTKRKTINFFRNDLRPLAFAIDHKSRVMYWMSESGLLREMLKRRGVDHSGVFIFSEGIQFKFDPTKIGGKEINDCYTTEQFVLPKPKKQSTIVHIGNKGQRKNNQQQQPSNDPPFSTDYSGDGIDIGWLSPEAREALSK